MRRAGSRVRDKLLEVLRRSPAGVLQSSLPSILGASKSRVSEILRELEEEGVVVREKVGTTYLVKLAQPRYRTPKLLRLGFVWSSEYGFLAELIKGLEVKLGIKVEASPYESPHGLAMDLVRGVVDLGLLPLATVILVSSSLTPLRVLGGGGVGGSFLLKLAARDVGIASTRASTMDLCRLAALKEGLARGPTTYYDSPEKALEMARKRFVECMALYQPLASLVEREAGARVEASCFELMKLPICCTLAASAALESELVSKVSKVYREVLERYDPRRPAGLDYYSRLTGIPKHLLETTCRQYSYVPSIDRRELAKVISVVEKGVPDPTWLEDAVLVEP